MTKRQQKQKGFTLVELAIVLVIVGLLIAGILKGQELIVNSQVTSTIQQIEAIGGAVNTFKQKYNSYPGDMDDADTRLANCDTDPCNNGDGDSTLENNVGDAPAIDEEGVYFFNHLRAAEIITNFDGSDDLTFGSALPTASIGGGFLVGDTRSGVTEYDDANMRPGPYLVLNGTVDDVDADSGSLTATQGARIDRTIDDGNASSGSVIAQDTDGACVETGGDDEYDEAEDAQSCSIAYRLPR